MNSISGRVARAARRAARRSPPGPRRRAREVTSSHSSSRGSTTSARAIATRWRSPPDSSSGKRSAHEARQRDALERLVRPVRSISRGGSTRTVERRAIDLPDRAPRVQRRVRVLEHVLDLPAGVGGRARAAPWPSCVAREADRRRSTRGAARPMQRASVVLPEPDSPTSATQRSRPTARSTSCSTCTRAVAGGQPVDAQGASSRASAMAPRARRRPRGARRLVGAQAADASAVADGRRGRHRRRAVALASEQRGCERAAARPSRRERRVPGDAAISPRAPPMSGTARSSRRVYGCARRAEDRVARPVPRRSARRTSPRRGRPARRRPRGRG